MIEPEKKTPVAPPAADFVKFHHKKSGFFRVVAADGAWGGVNQAGVVHLTFFSEHPSIPTSVTYPLKDGIMSSPPTAEGNEGIDREMEIDVALSIPAAMQVRATLDNFIKLAEEQMKQWKEQIESKIPKV
ncbi:MAG: hypothetical protein WBW71_14900 [Bacteroidota bacterium]